MGGSIEEGTHKKSMNIELSRNFSCADIHPIVGSCSDCNYSKDPCRYMYLHMSVHMRIHSGITPGKLSFVVGKVPEGRVGFLHAGIVFMHS